LLVDLQFVTPLFSVQFPFSPTSFLFDQRPSLFLTPSYSLGHVSLRLFCPYVFFHLRCPLTVVSPENGLFFPVFSVLCRVQNLVLVAPGTISGTCCLPGTAGPITLFFSPTPCALTSQRLFAFFAEPVCAWLIPLFLRPGVSTFFPSLSLSFTVRLRPVPELNIDGQCDCRGASLSAHNV